MKNIIIKVAFMLILALASQMGSAQNQIVNSLAAIPKPVSKPIFSKIEHPDLDERQKHYLQALDLKKNSKISFVKVNTTVLKKAEDLVINLPDTKSFRLNTPLREEWMEGREVWKAQTNENSANFVLNDSMVTGSIFHYNEHYRLYPLSNDLHVLAASGMHQELSCGNEASPSKGSTKALNPLNFQVPDDEDYFTLEKAAAEECKIRLLFAYTNAVDAATPDILSLIRLDVENFNTINQRSEVNWEVELACVLEVNYTEANTWQSVPGFTGRRSRDLVRFWHPNDGVMDGIHDLRHLYDADLCQLYTVSVAPGAAGIAMQINATQATAFCQSRWNTGFQFTPTHEFGHLIGMRHDIAADTTTTPYSFGHGFTYTGPGQDFRTVMGTFFTCLGPCDRIPNWSNPNVDVFGRATGNNASANNARVTRIRDQTVAGFQSSIDNKLFFRNDVIRDRELASIYANNSITTGGFEVDYRNGAFGEFVASDYIRLDVGFWARAGANFDAHLDPSCTPINLTDAEDLDLTKEASSEDLQDIRIAAGNIKLSYEDRVISLSAAPNPFTGLTKLQYKLSTAGPVQLSIHDLTGRELEQLVQQQQHETGTFQMVFDGSSLPAGMYVGRLITKEGAKTIKLIIE